LGTLQFGAVLPDLKDFVCGQIDFAVRMIRGAGIEDAQIQGGFAPFGSDLEHIVLVGANPSAADGLGPLHQSLNNFL
jgi:hypothetical protein